MIKQEKQRLLEHKVDLKNHSTATQAFFTAEA